MVRNRFDRDLELLGSQLMEMGALIEKAIEDAIKALIDQDLVAAKEVIEFDNEIDDKEKEIEALCLKLLLQQQPVAKDLRLISTALKMITDMERIGDQSADISEIAVRLSNEEYIKKLIHIPQMAEATIKMVKESVDAFVTKNLDLAYAVIEYDDVVDNLFDIVKVDLINLIREDAKNGEQAIDLLMVAKYFERIGDHAVNIAEWVVFSIIGKHPDDQ